MSRLKTLSLVGAIAILGIGALELKAIAARLTNWRFDSALNQLEITLDEGTTPRYFLLAQPPRIVLDLPNTQVGMVETQQSYSGSIRQIRVSQFEASVTRIVLDLSPEVVLAPEQVQLQQVESGRWVLRPLIAGFQASPTRGGVSPSLPPAIFPENQTSGVVSVSPLNNSSTVSNLTTPTVPPARISTNNNVSVSVPPLSDAIATAPPVPVRQPQSSSATRVVEFGQPLPMEENSSQVSARRTRVAPVPSLEPGASVPMPTPAPPTTATPTTTSSPTVVVPPLSVLSAAATVVPDPSSSKSAPIQAPNVASLNPEVLLPSGTPLSLRYPGDKVLTLRDGVSRQEVLLLEEEIRDRTGKLIAPVGTQVIGRFEIDRRGSRFITQAD